MSSPSTPRRTSRPLTASASPPPEEEEDRANASPQMLTPGRKIKAMLSAFDESDSDNEPVPRRRRPRSDGNPAMAQLNDVDNVNDEEEEEEGEGEAVMPRGRMAARMQGQGQGQTHTHTQSGSKDESGDKPETAFERVSRMIRAEKRQEEISESRGQKDNSPVDDGNSDGEEEEDIVAPRGRMAGRMQTESAQVDVTDESKATSERVSTAVPNTTEVPAESWVENDNTSFSDDDDDDVPTARRRRPAQNDEEHGSPSRARSFSPLFMSSPPTTARQNDFPDNQSQADGQAAADEEPQPQKGNARFKALVAQKRKEREEKEKVEAEKKAARAKQMQQFSSQVFSGDDSGDDNARSGRNFTQQSRPARKASKKAIEEMHRETQRMSRNMQLTHQMQTKKKITKDSLFARFNFMQSGPAAGGSSATASSLPSSDAEVQKGGDTPPTSPMVDAEKESRTADTHEQQPETKEVDDIPEELPTVEKLLSQPQEHVEGPAGQAETRKGEPRTESVKPNERGPLTAVPVRVRLSRQSVAQTQREDSDPDDDLDVVTSPGKCRRIAAFENLPARKAQEPAAMTKLKALAHLTSPTRRSASMNAAELSASLIQRARRQAAQERKERMQELRNKGIVIETAEDRAAMEDSVEDLMERARKEGVEIAKRENVSKQGDGPGDEDDADFELSGSDEEGYGDDEDEGDNQGDGEGYIEKEANEDNESDDEEPEVMSEGDAEVAPRRKRPTRVISDDEDEGAPRTPAKQTTQTVGSAGRPHFPDLPGSHGLTMSLTQAFAGTLGDNHTQKDGSTIPNSLPNSLPDPGQPAGLQEGSSQEVVKDSQEHRAESTDLLAGYTQADPRVSESPVPPALSSQVPEPTQDAGFILSPFDPSKRFMGTPTSTIETVLVGNEPHNDSPQKKRTLKRGQGSRLSPIAENQNNDFEIDASAFDVMKNRKPSTPFDRKKSKAKEVVEDAAEESDDEYAGLGGGSDDSEGEEDGYDHQMINDNSGERVDEKELAALNAIHDRATDEKQVAKLLKDINSGALRRRRGADDEFDLDDSDDERLARRREKQREFARMRKALLADEKVGEIAENPKKAAFFKAIEDRDSDDEVALDFLEEPAQDAQESSSQEVQGPSEPQQKEKPADETNKRKRTVEPSIEDITNRPPPHLRRKPASAMSKKPANLAEIRETVSFLTETPEYDSFHETASVDEHAEATDKTPEEQQPSIYNHPEDAGEFVKPTHPRRTRGPVIDRLALLRQASSNSASSTSASASTRFAFHAGSNEVGFRPSFARRAAGSPSSATTPTTTTTSDSNRRVSKAPASGKNMGKKGSVNYHTAAREREKERETRVKQRSGKTKIAALLDRHAANTLSALGEGQWD